MISNISSGMQQQPMARTEQTLSQEQQSKISETLSQFDPDNLSESDAQSIIESFSSAGIQPGKALESSLAELGFDAKSIGELAGVEKGNRPPPPAPPMQGEEEIGELVDYLTELLEEKLLANNNTELTDEDKESIYGQVSEKFGFDSDDSIINTSA